MVWTTRLRGGQTLKQPPQSGSLTRMQSIKASALKAGDKIQCQDRKIRTVQRVSHELMDAGGPNSGKLADVVTIAFEDGRVEHYETKSTTFLGISEPGWRP